MKNIITTKIKNGKSQFIFGFQLNTPMSVEFSGEPLMEFDEILENHEIPDEIEETQDGYIKRKRLEFLDEMVAHFSHNPRAINNLGECVYSHYINGGCAIGRKLPADLAKKFDEMMLGSISKTGLFDLLPPELSVLGASFLRKCQIMHDSCDYWKSGGLSNDGQTNFNSIITKFC